VTTTGERYRETGTSRCLEEGGLRLTIAGVESGGVRRGAATDREAGCVGQDGKRRQKGKQGMHQE
jgi:hypothetical protein